MPIIKDDTFHLDTSPNETVKGAKAEPEERPVAHVLTTEGSAVTMADADHSNYSDVHGFMPTRIISEITADDAAQMIGAQCGRCKHFNNAKWVEQYRDLRLSTDPRIVAYVDKLRVMFTLSDDPEIARRHGFADGTVNAEHAITAMGICSVFGNLCYPQSSCPPGKTPAWEGKTPRIEAETQQLRDQLLTGSARAAK